MKQSSSRRCSFVIFLKSAVITSLSLAIVCFLAFGLIFTDESINSAVGNSGGFNISQFDNNAVAFELSGREFKIDLRPVCEATDEIMKYYDVLPVELRTAAQATTDEQNIIEKYIERLFYDEK